MPQDVSVSAGTYKVRKRFRNEEHRRKKKDMPWTKHILNLNENQIFGRTPWAWCRIVSFYLVLYFAIFLIVLCLYSFFAYYFIVPERPNILKKAPGLSIVPTNESTIAFYTNQMIDVYPICDRIDDFLQKLDDDAINFFEHFNRDKLWGYSVGTPVFFVKLNKVIGYEPETYSSTSELPSDAPREVSRIMQKYPGGDRIWLTCEVTDGPSIQLGYFPGPYYDAEDLVGVNRVVGVQMSEVPENKKIIITCKVWAKNIEIDTSIQGQGNAKFKIQMKVKKFDNTSEEPDKNGIKKKNVHEKTENDTFVEESNYDDRNIQMPETPDLEPNDDDEITFSSDKHTEPPD